MYKMSTVGLFFVYAKMTSRRQLLGLPDLNFVTVIVNIIMIILVMATIMALVTVIIVIDFKNFTHKKSRSGVNW